MLPDSVIYCRDAFDAAQAADVLVLITEWNEFRALSPTRLRDTMRGRVAGGSAQCLRPGGNAAGGPGVSLRRAA